MTDALEPQVAAAMAYEELFVPALFRPWATRLADRVPATPAQRVLDVACGTGILARELAPRTGPQGLVAGLDVAPGMIAVARRLAPGIDFREGRAEALPWPDGSFTAVVSQFGLMFFEDRRGAIREMARVLVDGGRLAVAVWASLDEMPAFAAEVELLQRVAGQRAADALRAPFVLGDRAALTHLFEDAGLAAIEADTDRAEARFPSVRSLVEADLRGWLPLLGVRLDEPTIQRTLDEAETALARFVTATGALAFETAAHVVTATRPGTR